MARYDFNKAIGGETSEEKFTKLSVRCDLLIHFYIVSSSYSDSVINITYRAPNVQLSFPDPSVSM